jgi:hypothetical protein
MMPDQGKRGQPGSGAERLSATGPPLSRTVGKTAPVGNRMGYEVYEATRPDRRRECYDCGKLIAVGERFTRRTVSGGGSRRWPFCADCDDAEVAADA